MDAEKFPFLRKCLLEMIYDQGIPDALGCLERSWRRAAEVELAGYDPAQLAELEESVSLLDQEALERLTCGDEEELADVLSYLPEGADWVLDKLFDSIVPYGPEISTGGN